MRDYFVYLPCPEPHPVWGAAVTAAGFTRCPAGRPYPPSAARHPADHLFTWERGRVLDTWQLVLVLEGSGWFESQPTGRRRIEAGTLFLLFPGVWHRYTPDVETGWVESWLEFMGDTPERLRQAGVLKPQKAVLALPPQPDLAEALDHCHVLAQTRPMGYDAQLATSALHVLALALGQAQMPTGRMSRMQQVIRHAQTLLAERCDQPVQISLLARELGVAYSHFRRAFRAQTGLSPKQYIGQLRLRRVQDLLRTSSLSVKEIADRLGYHSPFHLSTEFKKRTGHAPTQWRARQQG